MKFDFYRWIDTVVGTVLIGVLAGLTKPFSRRKRGHPKRILVIRLWGMGDAVVSLPLVKALKDKYPLATVDVLARRNNKSPYEDQKFVDNIFEFEFGSYPKLFGKFGKYDLILDLEQYLNASSLLSWWMGKWRIGFSHGVRRLCYNETVDFDRSVHMADQYLGMGKLVGASYKSKTLLPLQVGKGEKEFVDEWLKDHKIDKKDKLVGVCSTVAESGRMRLWSDKKFAEACDQLVKKHGVTIVFTGSKKEIADNDRVIALMKTKAINSAGTSKRQAYELMSRFDVMLSLDTGPVHIAAAQGVPTVGIFGPNTPTLWAPYGPKNVSVYLGLPCSPCILNEKGQAGSCLRTTNKIMCMKDITVTQVVRAVEQVL